MTQILATVCGGPTWSRRTILQAIKLGVTSFRITPGFRSHQQNVEIVSALRDAAAQVGQPIQLYYDVSSGSKLRTVNPQPEVFTANARVTVGHAEHCDIKAERPISANLGLGCVLHLGDSDLALTVEGRDEDVYFCRVISGGKLGRGKAITAEGFDLGLGAINEKNIAEIESAGELGVDSVILSFVRDREDIRICREMVAPSIRIVAKIETAQALEELDGIVAESDMTMVARGDLAIQCGYERLALLQWRITEAAIRLGRPFIVATQVFESIIGRFIPARSDLLDLSYAVAAGAYAVMFGPETCMNPDCIRALQAALRVIAAVESQNLRVMVVPGPSPTGGPW